MWFSFGRVDVGQELRDLKVGQRRLEALIVALASIEQTVLDEFGTQLSAIADAVQAIVDDEGNDLGPADVSGITSAVTRLQEILTKPEEPVEPTPEPDPAPVEDAPVDEEPTPA